MSDETRQALGECLANSVASHPGFENWLQRLSAADVDPKLLAAIDKISKMGKESK